MTPVSRDIAAVLLAELAITVQRFTDAELGELSEHAELPPGMLTCGQAMRFIPSLMAMLHQTHPDLFDPDTLQQALHDANFTLADRSNFSLN